MKTMFAKPIEPAEDSLAFLEDIRRGIASAKPAGLLAAERRLTLARDEKRILPPKCGPPSWKATRTAIPSHFIVQDFAESGGRS